MAKPKMRWSVTTPTRTVWSGTPADEDAALKWKDERVKIDADPEDAIRALLKTPKRRVRSAASKKASDRKHD